VHVFGQVFGSIIKLFFISIFMLSTIYVQAESNDAPELLWLMITPFVLIVTDAALFVKTFTKGARKNNEMMHADDEWGSFVAQASFLRQVITDFRKGYAITAMFKEVHQLFNVTAYKAATHQRNAQARANMFPTLIASFMLVFLGWKAMTGQITVGAYIAFMNTINAVGPTIDSIFMSFFTIGKGYTSIIHVADLLNSETRRKMLFDQQIKRRDLIEKFRDELKLNKFPEWNPNEIVLKNVTFRFKHQADNFIPPMTCRMEGGQIIALRGSGSVGKKIVLRLMARHMVPNTGFVYYPTRWRVRFLDSTPLFFGGDMSKLAMARLQGEKAYAEARRSSLGTLEFNLKFGAQFKHTDAAQWDTEIYGLLKLLGVTPELIGFSAEEFSTTNKFLSIGHNGEKLSQTNRALLTIARALLSSADLFLISNVLDTLGPEQGEHAMNVLKVLTQRRSLEVLATEHHSTPLHLKKLKTVIFSTKLASLEAIADNRMYLDNA